MANTNKRIDLVDVFRCIAVLAVVLYHYLYRFSPPDSDKSYYPYQYGSTILRYGFFGVHLFFVISGFVIAQTLEKTNSFWEFMVRRLIRLWPALILCSIITFLVVKIFNQDQHLPFSPPNGLDFLPSWTFVPPEFWNMVLNQKGIVYMDGAYWSLFPEMVFYILGGIIYFLRPKLFLKNWLWVTLFVSVVRIVSSPRNQFLFPDALNSIFSVVYDSYLLLHFSYFVYFALGIFFYSLYRKSKPTKLTLTILFFLILFEFYFLGNNIMRILFLSIIVLFLLLVYKENWLNFLKLRIFVWIGLVSYPLYLLHENVGLILINQMAYLTDQFTVNFLPFIVAISMIMVSGLVFNYCEKPFASFLRVRLKRFNQVNSHIDA
jgi:peptidoglycan/LPS O-acetylase OafA/YrhL